MDAGVSSFDACALFQMPQALLMRCSLLLLIWLLLRATATAAAPAAPQQSGNTHLSYSESDIVS
eukprot:6173288-Pleurochrysis_carterae.AAC.3